MAKTYEFLEMPRIRYKTKVQLCGISALNAHVVGGEIVFRPKVSMKSLVVGAKNLIHRGKTVHVKDVLKASPDPSVYVALIVLHIKFEGCIIKVRPFIEMLPKLTELWKDGLERYVPQNFQLDTKNEWMDILSQLIESNGTKNTICGICKKSIYCKCKGELNAWTSSCSPKWFKENEEVTYPFSDHGINGSIHVCSPECHKILNDMKDEHDQKIEHYINKKRQAHIIKNLIHRLRRQDEKYRREKEAEQLYDSSVVIPKRPTNNELLIRYYKYLTKTGKINGTPVDIDSISSEFYAVCMEDNEDEAIIEEKKRYPRSYDDYESDESDVIEYEYFDEEEDEDEDEDEECYELIAGGIIQHATAIACQSA